MGAVHPWTRLQPVVFYQNDAMRTANPKTNEAESLVSFDECVTNNLSVECEDFFSIGQMLDIGGDSPGWWGDVDFGYRARTTGFSFGRANRALGYHHDDAIRNLPTASARAEKAAQMAIPVFHKVPKLEQRPPMFADIMPIDWGLDAPGQAIRKHFRAISSSSRYWYFSLGSSKGCTPEPHGCSAGSLCRSSLDGTGAACARG
jgi:hypothetical protein